MITKSMIRSMPAVLMSIRPVWFAAIMKGGKLVEIRKNAPVSALRRGGDRVAVFLVPSGSTAIAGVAVMGHFRRFTLNDALIPGPNGLTWESIADYLWPESEGVAWEVIGFPMLLKKCPVLLKSAGLKVPQSWAYMAKDAVETVLSQISNTIMKENENE